MPLSDGVIVFFKAFYIQKHFVSTDVLQKIVEYAQEFDEQGALEDMFIEHNGLHCECNKDDKTRLNHYFDIRDCDWSDVERNEDGKVISICLNHALDWNGWAKGGADCYGTSCEHPYTYSRILPCITNFRFLEQLEFRSVALTGEIPNEIGYLRNLKKLHIMEDIHGQNFPMDESDPVKLITGKLPETFSKLQKLEELRLYGQNLSIDGIEVIGTLKKLRVLELDLCFESEDYEVPDFIYEMTQLHFLCLKCFTGQISQDIKNLVNLTTFCFNGATGTIPNCIFTEMNISHLHIHGEFTIDFREIDESKLKTFDKYSRIPKYTLLGQRPSIYKKFMETEEELQQRYELSLEDPGGGYRL